MDGRWGQHGRSRGNGNRRFSLFIRRDAYTQQSHPHQILALHTFPDSNDIRFKLPLLPRHLAHESTANTTPDNPP